VDGALDSVTYTEWKHHRRGAYGWEVSCNAHDQPIGGGNDSHRQSREDVARGVGKGKRVHRVPHCLGRNGRFQRRVVTPPPPQHRGRRGALPECGTHPIRPMATPHGGHGRARAAVGRGGGVPAFAGNQTTGGIDTVGQRSPDQYGEAVLSELALRTPRSQRGGGAWHCEKGFSRGYKRALEFRSRMLARCGATVGVICGGVQCRTGGGQKIRKSSDGCLARGSKEQVEERDNRQ
jgi:hypothetical protein